MNEAFQRPTEPRARRRWPVTKRNQIAASVGIAAGFVAVAAAIFIGGVAVGAQSGGFEESNQYSATPAGVPVGAILIVPQGGDTGVPQGVIITGTEPAAMASAG